MWSSDAREIIKILTADGKKEKISKEIISKIIKNNQSMNCLEKELDRANLLRRFLSMEPIRFLYADFQELQGWEKKTNAVSHFPRDSKVKIKIGRVEPRFRAKFCLASRDHQRKSRTQEKVKAPPSQMSGRIEKIWFHRGVLTTRYEPNRAGNCEYPATYHHDYFNCWINNNDLTRIIYPEPPPSTCSLYEPAWIPAEKEIANEVAEYLEEAIKEKHGRPAEWDFLMRWKKDTRREDYTNGEKLSIFYSRVKTLAITCANCTGLRGRDRFLKSVGKATARVRLTHKRASYAVKRSFENTRDRVVDSVYRRIDRFRT